jgi:hypothetical protein
VTPTVLPRRVALSSLVAIFALLFGLVTPAGAAVLPDPTTDPPKEDSNPTLETLRSNLEAAAIGWLDAEAALTASKNKQGELQQQLTLAELDIARAKVGVKQYAGEAYKTGRLTVLGAMLNATSPDDFLGKAQAMERVTQRDEERIRQLREALDRANSLKKAIDEQINIQTQASAEMQKRKVAAERALSAVGGGATRGWLDPNSKAAAPAPRNPDGSWPQEGCWIKDPTGTGGCITPRTLHALNEAKAAGFTKYVSCWRPGDRWEHPKGRACDFSVFDGGFVASKAQGDNKIYGSNLAYFFVKNATVLGVMYVVWYCDIWTPTVGWHTYSSAGSVCGDDPAGDHVNHVHVSIY